MAEFDGGSDPERRTAGTVRARREVIREGVTMALYITISLLAVLVAVPGGDHSSVAMLGTIWGTAIGLTMAHVLAFRLSTKLVSAGELAARERLAIAAQAAASATVAAVASLPLLVTDGEAALDMSRLLLSGFVGICAYGVGRQSGGTGGRALLYASSTVVIALMVALLKNVLAGH